MNMIRKVTLIILIFATNGCEKNYSISNHISHYSKDLHFKIIKNPSEIPKEVRGILDSSIEHVRFPLAYYLIQDQDIQIKFNKKLDSNISDQLFMTVSGFKYYKLFVPPDLDMSYSFLQSAYRYIGPDQSEFFATSLESPKTLVVWSQKSKIAKPFVLNSKTKINQNRIPAYSLDHPESIEMLLKKDFVEKDYPIQGQEIMAVPSL